MNTNSSIAIIYCMMLVFDLSVIAGTAYMIQFYGWNAWWMLLAVALAAGSNPKFIIGALK